MVNGVVEGKQKCTADGDLDHSNLLNKDAGAHVSCFANYLNYGPSTLLLLTSVQLIIVSNQLST